MVNKDFHNVKMQ